MNHAWLGAALIQISSIPGATETGCFKAAHVTIENVGERPEVTSGVMALWMRITAKSSDGSTNTFFLPYLDERARYPSVGDKCTLTVKLDSVSGIVGRTMLNESINAALVVGHFQCDPKAEI